jgi:hypothetical protein
MKRQYKIRLLELLSNGEITKDQFRLVVKIGIPAPAILQTNEIEELTDRQKEILSLKEIYKKFGQGIFEITFENISKDS